MVTLRNCATAANDAHEDRRNSGNDKEWNAYIMSPEEVTAENLRRYMTDPNAYKKEFPNAAKALRKLINENMSTHSLFTLSKNEPSLRDVIAAQIPEESA